MNHRVLMITSIILELPVINNYIKTNDKTAISVDVFLMITGVISIIFWEAPVRNGIRHKFDSIFAKLSITLTSLYILFYKQNSILDKMLFSLGLFMMISFFILSNSCSRLKWCSRNHVITHAFFHLIIFVTLCESL